MELDPAAGVLHDDRRVPDLDLVLVAQRVELGRSSLGDLPARVGQRDQTALGAHGRHSHSPRGALLVARDREVIAGQVGLLLEQSDRTLHRHRVERAEATVVGVVEEPQEQKRG